MTFSMPETDASTPSCSGYIDFPSRLTRRSPTASAPTQSGSTETAPGSGSLQAAATCSCIPIYSLRYPCKLSCCDQLEMASSSATSTPALLNSRLRARFSRTLADSGLLARLASSLALKSRSRYGSLCCTLPTKVLNFIACFIRYTRF